MLYLNDFSQFPNDVQKEYREAFDEAVADGVPVLYALSMIQCDIETKSLRSAPSTER
jgi:hypothetical protein